MKFKLYFPKARQRFYGNPFRYLELFKLSKDSPGSQDRLVGLLEIKICEKTGSKYAIAMPQARVGIYLLVKALVKAGDKVLMSPYTIFDVVNMVKSAGGTPVFIDVDPVSCNLSYESLAKSLETPGTGAVLVTHLHGLAADIEKMEDLCRLKKIPLIEDCAQALGVKVGGRSAGTFGKAGVYSFGMAKNVNSLYGGAIVTDDGVLASRIRKEMDAWPMMEKSRIITRALFCLFGTFLTWTPIFTCLTYWVFRLGELHDIQWLKNSVRGEMDPELRESLPASYLRKMSPLQADLALAQIDRVDQDYRLRRETAKLYDRGLNDLPQVLLPPWKDDESHIYLVYPVQVDDRKALLKYMFRHFRDVSIQHLVNNADARCFSDYYADCPNARKVADSVLLLPAYPGYNRANAEANIRVIRQYFLAKEKYACQP